LQRSPVVAGDVVFKQSLCTVHGTAFARAGRDDDVLMLERTGRSIRSQGQTAGTFAFIAGAPMNNAGTDALIGNGMKEFPRDSD
jgi:hypothetical protein